MRFGIGYVKNGDVLLLPPFLLLNQTTFSKIDPLLLLSQATFSKIDPLLLLNYVTFSKIKVQYKNLCNA